jgi:hypothetical protein
MISETIQQTRIQNQHDESSQIVGVSLKKIKIESKDFERIKDPRPYNYS